MPERGRGRSPGAKGTAYPRAQRPQKEVPVPAATPGPAASLKGKTLHLQQKPGRATLPPAEPGFPRPSKAAPIRAGSLAKGKAGQDGGSAGNKPAGSGGRVQSGGLDVDAHVLHFDFAINRR